MTDRELLELAAKASGIHVIRSRLDDPMWRDMLVDNAARNVHHNYGGWNPLTDDGDALRLAVKLKFNIEWDFNEVSVNYAAAEFEKEDPYAATRRAIVRAAAEICKGDAQC